MDGIVFCAPNLQVFMLAERFSRFNYFLLHDSVLVSIKSLLKQSS
jgi:hypothetical protein